MVSFIAGLLVLGIFGVLILIALGLMALVALVYLVAFIVLLIKRFRASYKYDHAVGEYGMDSIGELIARGEADAAKGDVDALLATSVDREDAMRIMDWFNDTVTSGDYYTIMERDPVGQEPNYAIVMTNRSGFNFKEFSCKATPRANGEVLPVVTCTVKDWRKRKEGQLWFYCPNKNVNRLTIDIKSLSYRLGISKETDRERRHKQRIADLEEMAKAASAASGGKSIGSRSAAFDGASAASGGGCDDVTYNDYEYDVEEAIIERENRDPLGLDDYLGLDDEI